ncbi:MAG: GatB/YqeY domain-containing protein [Bacteroidota bacterium]|nr:GatB/YqeY domain-containing protein [Bacteroidota bacterium]MDP4204708.1 GatB/YqeY domain-containing protein [Bacteroidota bacterium]
MSLFDTINNDIKAAMLAREKVRLEALRNVKKVLIEAKTAKSGHDELSDEDAMKAIQKLVKQGKDSAEIYKSQNREDLAEQEIQQVLVMEAYLPKPMSEEELRTAVQNVITQVGATSMKEMGKVMGVASKELAGKADGKAISAMVKNLLG